MHESSARDEQLADALAALGSTTRLAILRKLRAPLPLVDIEVRAESGDRPLSRQGVKEHLTRLMDLGIVLGRAANEDGRSPTEYVANHQALWSIAEELRLLARHRPTVEPEVETIRRGLGPPPSRLGRDCLVLVKGPDEGRAFDLSPARGGPWLVGRKRTAEVCLDFDAQVSSENALVEWDGGGHTVRDLPGSRNGTTLNLEPLPKGQPARLAHGDLVGVGRTLLLYRH